MIILIFFIYSINQFRQADRLRMFIYKLKIKEYVYYGSSVKSLKEVYIMLKNHSNAKKTRDNRLYSIINLYGVDNIELSIYKNLNDVSRKELNSICWDVVNKHRNDMNLLNTRYLGNKPKKVEG